MCKHTQISDAGDNLDSECDPHDRRVAAEDQDTEFPRWGVTAALIFPTTETYALEY